MRQEIFYGDEKKIAFILCVNDGQEYEECAYYLNRLLVPAGFEKDIVTVQDAPSMAAGYQAGMRSSDAKYKVYLHQDVFIINRNFIADLLRVFDFDSRIGLVGMIGTDCLESREFAVTSWNRGKVLNNCVPPVLTYPPSDGIFAEVQAVDGLLVATQYDVPWREDLFGGWDFYDISQCMEMRRAGYRVAVPFQEKPWCYHDNSYSKMVRYEYYQNVFAEEYQDIAPFKKMKSSHVFQEFTQTKEILREQIADLMECGERAELRDMFRDSQNQGYLFLREYETIVSIDLREEENNSKIRFWRQDMSVQELVAQLRRLKYMLKRIEFDAEDGRGSEREVCGMYSVYAIEETAKRYVLDKERLCRMIEI